LQLDEAIDVVFRLNYPPQYFLKVFFDAGAVDMAAIRPIVATAFFLDET
jgi:hypothetical protein